MGDYDNDGKLDLYITRYFSTTNLLFHNDGNGNFTKVLNAGPIVTDANSSAGCSWGDYNKDGLLDMFVANGQNQNDALYKNNGNSTFTRIINDPIVLDGAESRGCSWGDYNNDTWPDMFVVNYGAQNDMLYKNNGNGTFTRIYNPVQQMTDYMVQAAVGLITITTVGSICMLQITMLIMFSTTMKEMGHFL